MIKTLLRRQAQKIIQIWTTEKKRDFSNKINFDDDTTEWSDIEKAIWTANPLTEIKPIGHDIGSIRNVTTPERDRASPKEIQTIPGKRT